MFWSPAEEERQQHLTGIVKIARELNLYKDSYNPHYKQEEKDKDDDSSVAHEDGIGHDAIQPPVFLGDSPKVSRKFQRKKRQLDDVQSMSSLISNTNMQTTHVPSQGSVDDDVTSQEYSGRKKDRKLKSSSLDFDESDDDDVVDKDDDDDDDGDKRKVMIECECGNDHCGLTADSSHPPELKACVNAKGNKNGKCKSGILIFKECQSKICISCYNKLPSKCKSYKY